MKRAARSSSNSGCVGFSPCTPKSLGVPTSGLPMCQAQTRLTMTRAASGAASLKILSASSSRPDPWLKLGSLFARTAGKCLRDDLAGRGQIAGFQERHVAGFARLVMNERELRIAAIDDTGPPRTRHW